MNWLADSDISHPTSRSAGRAEEDMSAATLRIMREADATMSPGERDEYAGEGPALCGPHQTSLGHSPRGASSNSSF
jgi:hypothetical protein